MKTLEGKIAIVTGASKGIGAGIAERLARDGASVVVNYSSSEASANEVIKKISDGGGRAIAIKANVSVVAEVSQLFEETVNQLGRPDFLVANAGTGGLHALADITEADYERMFNINTKSTVFLLQQAEEYLNDNGNIVAISSATVEFPRATTALYAGSKAAMEAILLVAAKELGKRGICANIIRPGLVDTPILDIIPNREAFVEAVATTSPFQRIGKSEDVADVVAFLVSHDSRWVTGQTILVNGGAVPLAITR